MEVNLFFNQLWCYFLIGLSSVFYFVAIVSLIQLLICIAAEYQRLKQPTFLRACRITTQKLLYFFVFFAAVLRGAYFTTPVSIYVTYGYDRSCILNAELSHAKYLSTGNFTTWLGFVFNVCILSTSHDMCITSCMLMGRGELSILF